MKSEMVKPILIIVSKRSNEYFVSSYKNIFHKSAPATPKNRIEKKIKEIYTFNRLFNYLQQFLIALGITYSTFEKRCQC